MFRVRSNLTRQWAFVKIFLKLKNPRLSAEVIFCYCPKFCETQL